MRRTSRRIFSFHVCLLTTRRSLAVGTSAVVLDEHSTRLLTPGSPRAASKTLSVPLMHGAMTSSGLALQVSTAATWIIPATPLTAAS